MGTFGVEAKVKIKIIQYVCICYITFVSSESHAIAQHVFEVGDPTNMLIDEGKDTYSELSIN